MSCGIPKITLAILVVWCAFVQGFDAASNPPERCNLPIDPGSSDEFIHSYGYSPEKGRCVPFFYKGIGGNSNRFSSLQECNRVCVVPK
ncbi:hypothetical protein D915_002385 [Fasciola hepatica]|uniref:BPTI/Kunitz inhibitor domain-containing protein n=1 Tax=Fasciola hepatica TaxID=6192 RepID=A0A4E0RFY0_FASHE|nr:hypothetical protein D915_002385 [Fasciola hepatica]